MSSNTPWFFSGMRVQWFPTNKLKIEPWIINGWQSYAKYDGHTGFGGQILYMPKEWLKLLSNEYGFFRPREETPPAVVCDIEASDRITLRSFYARHGKHPGAVVKKT